MSRSSARLLADLLDSTGDVKLENLDNIEDAVNGTAKRQSFTATAGQTTFNVAGGFDSGYVDVYMDGVKLHTSDFADTSGTAIVLALGASENQLIDVIAYGTFTLLNLGIPDINTLQTSLDAKIDDTQVLTDVPSGALFTDTVYSKPSNEPISYITGLQTALNGKQASGSYETADATILKDADIGTTVLAPDGDGSQLTNLPAGGGPSWIRGRIDDSSYASWHKPSGAISNVVNTATGRAQIYWATPMGSAEYIVQAQCWNVDMTAHITNKTTTYVEITTQNNSNNYNGYFDLLVEVV